MTCRACQIEAEIGTEEVPHPVDARLHVCTDLDPKAKRREAARHLRAALAMVDEETILLAAHEVTPQATTGGVAFDVEVIVRKTPRGGWAVQYGATLRGDPLAVSGGLSGERPTLDAALKRAFGDVTARIRDVMKVPVENPWVIVNGERKDDVPLLLAYAGVCKLAGLEPSTFPTVTYSYPDGRHGCLAPGDARVDVEVGMRFTAIHTGNA